MKISGGACEAIWHLGKPTADIRPKKASIAQQSGNGRSSSSHTYSGRRSGKCWGILDSYRKEQEVKKSKAEQAEQRREEDLGGVKMLVYDSVDEDTCPAECVTEVFSATEFKQVCQVRQHSNKPLHRMTTANGEQSVSSL